MRILATGQDLADTLVELLDKHERCSFAVAWARSGHPVYKALLRHRGKIVRGIIGTAFYQTDPKVLEDFVDAHNVAFILRGDGTFHPKVYWFETPDHGWDMLLGSANLTRGAFQRNAELMVHVSSQDGAQEDFAASAGQIFADYWDQAMRIHESDVDAYRKAYPNFRANVCYLTNDYGESTSMCPTYKSSIMTMGWDEFYERVCDTERERLDKRCHMLEHSRKSMCGVSFQALPEEARMGIAGIPMAGQEMETSEWRWFGHMPFVPQYHEAITRQTRAVSDALDAIPSRGRLTFRHYEAYWERFLKAFPEGKGHGLATFSRLLSMKRPDVFVCCNGKNVKALCDDFGIPLPDRHDYQSYWDEIVCRIKDSPWWRIQCPAERMQARVWRGRAAMLDCILR